MDKEIAEKTSILGVLRDAVACVVLLVGSWSIELLRHKLYGDSTPSIISWIIYFSDASLFLAFLYLLLRVLTKVVIEFNNLVNNIIPALELFVASPTRWLFWTLRGIGDSALIGIIVGTSVALIIVIIIVLSQTSYWLSLALLIIPLGMIGIGIQAAAVDLKSAARSGGLGVAAFFIALILSLPVVALIFAGLAERWTGLLHSFLWIVGKHLG